ncbi:phenylalanine ammonia-lyase [Puccinia sorghi]|uniref:Phenylalanine ammonia-lyase n=1 Tax=Puccinia sorghi TaxID=27349 RepID=A0A0L6UII8_9BASI|nr:phenylalanine ammonia-lyase [Puccinia sorghi]
MLHVNCKVQAHMMLKNLHASAMETALLKFAFFSSILVINKGFPSFLNGNKPSTKYHTKGVDKFCAAYFSEHQYPTFPVTTRFQIAKYHSQAIKSLDFRVPGKHLRKLKSKKVCEIFPSSFLRGMKA